MTEFHFTSQQPVTTLETDSFLLLHLGKFKENVRRKLVQKVPPGHGFPHWQGSQGKSSSWIWWDTRQGEQKSEQESGEEGTEREEGRRKEGKEEKEGRKQIWGLDSKAMALSNQVLTSLLCSFLVLNSFGIPAAKWGHLPLGAPHFNCGLSLRNCVGRYDECLIFALLFSPKPCFFQFKTFLLYVE